MCFGQLGLVYENLIIASGKFVGEGEALRMFSKARFIFHVVGIPLLAIPITDVAIHCNVFEPYAGSIIQTLLTLYALIEFCLWLPYDINQLKVVDLRDSDHHVSPYLAGTLAYTSGKVVELALPAILLVFYEFLIGWKLSCMCPALLAGQLLSASAVITFLACATKGRPDIQLLGENIHGGLIWAAVASLKI